MDYRRRSDVEVMRILLDEDGPLDTFEYVLGRRPSTSFGVRYALPVVAPLRCFLSERLRAPRGEPPDDSRLRSLLDRMHRKRGLLVFNRALQIEDFLAFYTVETMAGCHLIRTHTSLFLMMRYHRGSEIAKSSYDEALDRNGVFSPELDDAAGDGIALEIESRRLHDELAEAGLSLR